MRGRVVGAFVDVFNLSNQAVADSDWPDVVNASPGANFGVPFRWRLPRQGVSACA